MKLLALLFSFRGRAPRSIYWFVTLVTAPVFLTELAVSELDEPTDWLPEWLVAWAVDNALLLTVLSLTAVVSAVSVQVRRWHDRDKSAWWLAINLVPVVGQLWALVENGLLAGTRGANRYGPDPLGGTTVAPATTRPVPVLVDLDQRKQCPHCGEFLRTESRRCEWCGVALARGWHHAMP